MKLRKLFAAGAVAALALLGQETIAKAETTYQFPTSPWGGFAPARVECGSLIGANMNTTADQAIPIAIPSYTFLVDSIVVSNPSISLSTAAGGLYTAASKGGTAVVANTQVYTGLTTNAANTSGNVLTLTLAAAAGTTALLGFGTGDVNVIYLSLTTAQGAAATADVRIFCKPLY